MTSTAEAEDQIEAGLLSELGYEVVTLVRTPKELAEVVAHRPFSLDVVRRRLPEARRPAAAA